MTNKEPVFNFVIARPWEPNNYFSRLCVYTFGNEVQTGTMSEAIALLEYVKRQLKHEGEAKSFIEQYGIYTVGYAKVL